ncbi:MAG TPA: hypothetical protein VKB67_01670 [Rhizomicrobium sp.]|nr:hypothetical protein [Rhizomicrobium sp.]
MRGVSFLMAVLLALPLPAMAAIAPGQLVSRVDSVIATEKGGRLTVQAKGAVTSGGWKRAALKPVKSVTAADAHVLVLNFVAEPPQPTDAVIPGLLPVAAAISLKTRKGIVSVRAVSGSNEITTQILKQRPGN